MPWIVVWCQVVGGDSEGIGGWGEGGVVVAP